MKLFTIILNTFFIFFVAYMFMSHGWPRKGEQQLLIFMLAILPIINLVTIIKYTNETSSESWLSLFFQRKKLEEKAKLEKLRNNEKQA